MKNKILIIFVSMFLMCGCDSTDTQTLLVVNNGRELYSKHCANCHQEDGSGLAQLIPPLKDADFISRFPERIPCIIRNGVAEKMSVNNKAYQLKMPANKKLSDKEIFYITGFVHFKFANRKNVISNDSISTYLKSCR